MSSLCHCPCYYGVTVIDAQASLQSKHLCCCCNNVVALVVMALSLLSSWCCRPCHNGIIAIVNVQVSLPLSGWCCCPLALVPLPTLHSRCCPCCAGIVVPIALTSFPSCYMGVITVIVSELLPLSSWRVSTIALVPLLLSCWSYCPQCAGISAHIMQASLPSLCLHRAVHL